jgi:hypothetical protein
MKLEMGESLAFSWLRHEKHCQTVQLNWKVSPEWDKFVGHKEVDRLYKKSNRLFKFASKAVKNVEQLIKQGEVDVMGIELDTDSLGTIKTIHAVDVAFHGDGLNLGGVEETKHRMMKKYIRTALSIYEYFGRKDAEIYFVTPNTKELYRNTYVEATKMVNDFFKEEGFSFSFHFYTNEDFYHSIYIPVERISANMTDTSELFARSLKLVKLMQDEREKESKKDIKEEISYSLSEEKKIGFIAKEAFDKLSKHQLLSKRMIQQLQSQDYSRTTFKLSYPTLLLKDDEKEDQRFYDIESEIYYVKPYTFYGQEYFLCNDWHEDRNRKRFIEWYKQVISNK